MPRIEAATVAEHNAMRRRQVADAAAAVLADSGVSGFTPAAVARRAGLARSSMYQYYPSTEALLAAAVAELLRGSRDRVAAAVASEQSPADRVRAYVAAALDDASLGHSSVAQLSALALPESCREAVRALHDELLEPLRSALASAGVRHPREHSLLVQGLVNTAVSAIAHGADRDTVAEATVGLVLRGLGLAEPVAS